VSDLAVLVAFLRLVGNRLDLASSLSTYILNIFPNLITNIPLAWQNDSAAAPTGASALDGIETCYWDYAIDPETGVSVCLSFCLPFFVSFHLSAFSSVYYNIIVIFTHFRCMCDRPTVHHGQSFVDDAQHLSAVPVQYECDNAHQQHLSCPSTCSQLLHALPD
jgi:hypothetical protein